MIVKLPIFATALATTFGLTALLAACSDDASSGPDNSPQLESTSCSSETPESYSEQDLASSSSAEPTSSSTENAASSSSAVPASSSTENAASSSSAVPASSSENACIGEELDPAPIWNDEFNCDSLDESSWSYEIGNGEWGWGNNEKQYYTDRPENIYVKDGYLHIRALKEAYQGSDYTSARIITKHKKSFTYGTVEARIALPKGKGIWPAFWMLGENIDEVSWPKCGEIDIIEAVNEESVVYGTHHWYADGQADYGNSTKEYYGTHYDLDITEFHNYKMTWDSKMMTMYVDDFKYQEIAIDGDGGIEAFRKPFFFVLNVAVGGQWPGFDIDDSQFPNEMLVDYIRVYK